MYPSVIRKKTNRNYSRDNLKILKTHIVYSQIICKIRWYFLLKHIKVNNVYTNFRHQNISNYDYIRAFTYY